VSEGPVDGARVRAWLVEYGHVGSHPASLLIAGRPAGELWTVPFCFAAVDTGTALVLVDVGFSSAHHRDRLGAKYTGAVWCPPVAALRRLGLNPAGVDAVLVTHKHFDHAGALPDFPAARVFLRREEHDAHRAALARPDEAPPSMFRATDPDVLDVLDARAAAGLLTLVDGDGATVHGIELRPALDTHTPGSQYAVLPTPDGPLFFPGDNVSCYRNIEGGLTPITSLTGPEDRWRAWAGELLAAAGGDTGRIVPFHDDEVWGRFRTHTFADGLRAAALTPGTPLPRSEGT
jgi:N-acyl homoserine lactone hydrolase